MNELDSKIRKLEREVILNDLTQKDPTEINNTFVSYYTTLYNSDCLIDTTNQNNFLDGLVFPCVSGCMKSELEKVLNLNDISNAITSMKGWKASGPDGLPIDVYKLSKAKFIAPLLDFYLESFKAGSLPVTLQSALITLLKPGKVPSEHGSYRPISLKFGCKDHS